MKKILIVGASSDIGSAIALQLSSFGHALILTGRDSEKLQTLESEISKNCEVTTYNLDVTDHIQTKEIYSAIKEKNTSIDWIIYSVGCIEKEERYDEKYTKNSFEINVSGFAEIIYYFEDILSENGGVISISSTAGVWGNPDYPIYSSSKAALNVFTSSIHKKWLTQNKYAFSICPGPTNTQMRERIAHDAVLHQKTSIVAEYIGKILTTPEKYKNHPLYIVRENKMLALNQETIEVF